MDEFGVLTERFGLKPQGKSAPMAASKLSGDGNTIRSSEFGFHSAVNAKSSSYSDFEFGSFSSNTKTESYGGLDDYGDILGSFNKLPKNSVSSGGDSLFMGSSNAGASATASIFPGFDDGDMFNSVLGFKGSGSTKDDDPMGLFSSPSKPRAHGDELLGDFGRNNAKSMSQERNGWNQAAKSSGDFDELIPGFGGSSPSKGEKTEAKLPKPQTAQATNYAFTSTEDPFSVFEKSSTPAYPSSDLFSDPVEQISKFNNSADTKLGGSSNASSQFRSPSIPKPVSYEVKSSPIDELEAFAMGKVQNNAGVGKTKSTVKASKPRQATDTAGENQQKNEDYLESVFGTGSRSRSVPKSRATTLDPLFNGNLYNKKPEVPKRTSLTSSGMKKSSSVTNAVDDFSSVFGVAASLFGDFEEHEGDNEERWRARMGRRQRTEDRMAEALADMNRRNFQAKQEQEERHRIAETLDDEIKRWAAGKEGNMRALLSSLHYVLWPECGWQPVSLTDIITPASVKKVYMKANLYVHPDKVQQRGANLEQKYRAEKVFDILKEAWNKFNKDELS